jgi:hypothetical protein
MGTRSPARIPKINLSKYVNIGGKQWRFCQVVVSANARIKPRFKRTRNQQVLCFQCRGGLGPLFTSFLVPLAATVRSGADT